MRQVPALGQRRRLVLSKLNTLGAGHITAQPGLAAIPFTAPLAARIKIVEHHLFIRLGEHNLGHIEL